MDLILVDTRSGRRRTFPLSARPLLLGRGVDCDVVLPDDEIAEQSCRLTEARGAVHFESLTPTGATLNGFAVRSAEVRPGDVVRVGPFQIVLATSESAVAAFADEAASAAAKPAPSRREEPRPVSTRRRPAAKSNAGPFLAIVILAAGGGIWFWKSHAAKSDGGTDLSSGPQTPPKSDEPTKGDGATTEDAGANGKDPNAAGNPPANGGATRNDPGGAAGDALEAAGGAAVAGAGKEGEGGAADPTKPTPSDELDKTMQRVRRLLEYEEYSRCRWLLSQTKPGTPKERGNVVALQSNVESTGRKAGEEYLAFVEKLIKKGWVLPALNHLQDESIERFRGFEIWYRLTERADLLEDEVDKLVPAERRPIARVKHGRPRPPDIASLPPPPIALTDTEREMDGTSAASRPTGVTAATAGANAGAKTTPTRVADPLSEARKSIDALRFDEAAAVLEAMPRSTIGEVRESRRQRMAAWAVAARRIAGAGADNQGLDPKDAAQKLTTARAAEHPAREWLDVAWLALALHDDVALDPALEKASADAALKGEIDSALAFRRGLEGIPAGGFTCVEGKWMTAAERDGAAARGALDAAIAELAKAKENAMRGPTTRLVEASKSAPALAAELLRARGTAIGKQMGEAAEHAALEALRARVQALADARIAAFTFAFDDTLYPLAPGSDAAGTKKLADANKELDKRVSAVRLLWGNEQGAAPDPAVDLSDDYASLVRQAHVIEGALAEIHEAAPDDPEFTAARLLPSFTTKVTVRNFALSVDERRRIDNDREVKARNQVVKEEKNPAELELLHIVNAYRDMLGAPQLAFDPRLYDAARGYCEVMAPQAKKEKDDAPQPEPRLALEKPKPAPGEIYLRGKFSARQALQAWLRVPGNHRNLLFARHRAIGPANVGNFWTCSFGLIEPAAK